MTETKPIPKIINTIPEGNRLAATDAFDKNTSISIIGQTGPPMDYTYLGVTERMPLMRRSFWYEERLKALPKRGAPQYEDLCKKKQEIKVKLRAILSLCADAMIMIEIERDIIDRSQSTSPDRSRGTSSALSLSSYQKERRINGIRSVTPRGEYSRWRERFMNYLEEQTDGEAMINSIHNGDQPLPVIVQVSLARNAHNAPPTLKDPKFWTAEEKKTRKIDRLARSLLIQGLPNDIYSLIDSNETAKDLWDALERQMRGFEYGE
nr:hypothetical protein [Tanacetum cinerariifolium]